MLLGSFTSQAEEGTQQRRKTGQAVKEHGKEVKRQSPVNDFFFFSQNRSLLLFQNQGIPLYIFSLHSFLYVIEGQ